MGKKVTLGLIGLGARGIGLLKTVFLHHEDVEFAVVCDVYEDRCQEAAELIEKSGRPRPQTTLDPSAVTGGPVTGLPSHESSPVPLRSHLHPSSL